MLFLFLAYLSDNHETFIFAEYWKTVERLKQRNFYGRIKACYHKTSTDFDRSTKIALIKSTIPRLYV